MRIRGANLERLGRRNSGPCGGCKRRPSILWCLFERGGEGDWRREAIGGFIAAILELYESQSKSDTLLSSISGTLLKMNSTFLPRNARICFFLETWMIFLIHQATASVSSLFKAKF